MNMIKRSFIAAFVALLLGTAANAAVTPLTVGDSRYVGSITDGIPPNVTNESNWVNYLITLSAGQVVLAGAPANTYPSETFSRAGSTVAGLPTPATYGDKDDSGPFPSIVTTGFSYVLGKYGNSEEVGAQQVSYVWYVGGLSEVSIPTAGLSHVTRFTATNSDIPGTPDGGSTVALLGLGLAALALARRKLA